MAMLTTSRNASQDEELLPVQDPAMPFLSRALDGSEAQVEFARALASEDVPWAGRVRAVRVRRFKPQRRCLVEYDVVIPRLDRETNLRTWMGKVRARGTDRATFGLLQELWGQGFDQDASDHIRTVEPIALIPAFNMWLAGRAPGSDLTELLPLETGPELAVRAARALLKLHRANIHPPRHHTIDDELMILRKRLGLLVGDHPELAERVGRVLRGCERLTAQLPQNRRCPIHRDFYPGQLLISGETSTLLDLDLCAWGDPALDVGNFLAHLTEQSLRLTNDPGAWAKHERAFESAYLAGYAEVSPISVAGYTTLALARLIQISTQFAKRRHLTLPLIDLCEARLACEHLPL